MASLPLASDLTFQQRVEAQRAVERVYYAHQIGAAAPFERAVPTEVLEGKVRRYLKLTVALERLWGVAVTADLLRDELERIARHTALPDRLEEIYAALGHDSVLVQECFVRPVLVERLVQGILRRQVGSDTAWESWWRRHNPLLDEAAVATVASPVGGLLEQRRDAVALKGATSAGTSAETAAEKPWCPGVDDHWLAISTAGTPVGRIEHTAVWTGNLMIVWGGDRGMVVTTFLNSGGRYDPLTDTWSPTSQLDAPAPRRNHTAVWTGRYMVIWGGDDGSEPHFNSGGRYEPISDAWLPTSTASAPEGRSGHTAVWTGSRMIMWGGAFSPADGFWPTTFGLYDPAADVWQTKSTAGGPQNRFGHVAAWTGREMVVWGGVPHTTTGGRYDPAADRWLPTSLTNAPEARSAATAVWTGTRLLVWGGRNSTNTLLGTGGVYEPDGDVWSPTTTAGAPAPRYFHSGGWSGGEMMVWGGLTDAGSTDTGGRYDPVTDSWAPTTTTGAPSARGGHSAVWTGQKMVVWGGGSDSDTGGRYALVPPPPPEVTNLRWLDAATLEWDACPGGAAYYDIMSGELASVSEIGSAPGEVCQADQHPSTQLEDASPAPAPGQGRYFLVRATTPAGAGTYGHGSGGEERSSAACP